MSGSITQHLHWFSYNYNVCDRAEISIVLITSASNPQFGNCSPEKIIWWWHGSAIICQIICWLVGILCRLDWFLCHLVRSIYVDIYIPYMYLTILFLRQLRGIDEIEPLIILISYFQFKFIKNYNMDFIQRLVAPHCFV